jgi:RNA polymerase sigma-70 factor (ECF subfamily)
MKAVMDDEGEDRLVRRAQDGDLDAYTVLVRRYRERIYQTIFRFTRNHDDTDDLAQETFLRAFQQLRRFRRRSGFYTWIYRIALNLSFNHLKKRKKEMGRQEFASRVPGLEKATQADPEAISGARELRSRLVGAVDSLPLPFRSAFSLVVFQGLTHGQAARVLGCSENTVSWRMHKARKILQAELRPFLKETTGEM